MKPSLTLTGIDARCSVRDLLQLEGAELGILYSASESGKRNRYPTKDELVTIVGKLVGRTRSGLALHICGTVARLEFIRGELDSLLPYFQRVQLNGPVDPTIVVWSCGRWPEKKIITQHGKNYPKDYDWKKALPLPNHQVLVDGSGGRGISPPHWTKPFQEFNPAQVGYAGGLGPDNLVTQLPRIAKVAEGDWWIDMEQNLRNEDDWFDIDKARRVCKTFNEFIG